MTSWPADADAHSSVRWSKQGKPWTTYVEPMSAETKFIRAYDTYIESTGYGPPYGAVASGAISLREALPWLVEKHEYAMHMALNTPSNATFARRKGVAGVSDQMLNRLSAMAGVRASDIKQAQVLATDASALVDVSLQPLTPDNSFDGSILFPECDAILDENGWTGYKLRGFATPSDVRMQEVLSQIAITPTGVAWATIYRPHHAEFFAFQDVSIVCKHNGRDGNPRWHFVLDDWHRRTLAAKNPIAPEDFDEALALIRNGTSAAGLSSWIRGNWAGVG